MKSRLYRIGVLVAVILAAAFSFGGDVVQAAGPQWMQGFPLRAGSTVILMWTPVPGATEYKLQKKVDAGDFKEVYKGPMNNFNDPDAPVTKTIEYKVVPVAGGKDGDPSVSVTLKGIEPLKPPTFTGVLPSADSVSLRWTLPSGTMFFNLYRAEKKDGPFSLLGSIQQDSYTDRNLKKGKTYYYMVSAVDRNNTESAKSAVTEAKFLEAVEAVVEKVVIRKVTPKGTFTGEELYEFKQPLDIGFTKVGELYVMDSNSIQFLDKDGKYQRRINFNPAWGLPSSAVPAPDGGFLVAFPGDQILRRIDHEGKLVGEKGEMKYPPVPDGKRKNNPNCVVVDAEGNYWIADGGRHQLIKVAPDGKELAVIGRLPGTYEKKVESDLPGVIRVYIQPGTGTLYAILGISAEIKVIDPKTMKVVKTLGGIGAKNRQFQGVGGMHFRKNGNILVFDQMMLTVKEFTKDFTYVATYVDQVEKDRQTLSANFASGFFFREEINRLYILAGLTNLVHMYDLPL